MLASLEGDYELLLLSCIDDDKESSTYHNLEIDELRDEQFHILFIYSRKKTYVLCATLMFPRIEQYALE